MTLGAYVLLTTHLVSTQKIVTVKKKSHVVTVDINTQILVIYVLLISQVHTLTCINKKMWTSHY